MKNSHEDESGRKLEWNSFDKKKPCADTRLGCFFKDDEKLLHLDILNNLNDLIAIIDENGERLYLSNRYPEFLGYSLQNPIGKGPLDLIHPDDREHAKMILAKSFQHGSAFKEEIRFRHANGSWIWLEVSGNPFFPPGQQPILLTVSRDVTSRKKMENELIAMKNKADRMNRAKSEFLSNMSHELRTPLNAILGFSQILRDDVTISSAIPAEGTKYLQYINEAGTHLLEMVNDILDLSKVEAQRLELKKKYFDIAMMLSRSPSTVIAIAREKKIRMVTEIDPDLGYVNGDEVRIKQVIYNLLTNAIKYTYPGKRVGISANSKQNSIQITIWDEGKGIDPAILDKLFTPFERGAEEENDNTTGTGLGLVLSKRLIELHEGTLTVQSTVGKGTRILIELPGRISHAQFNENAEEKKSCMPQRIDESLVGTDSYSNPSTEKQRKKVLVVDDNSASNTLVTAYLRKDGYVVHCVESGRDGVQKALSEKFDLILMDIQLPELDGITAMKRIRDQRSDHQTPIIALTAFAMKGDRERFLGHGFDEYISKPLVYPEFSKKIKQVFV